jgi:hypothetical protein
LAAAVPAVSSNANSEAARIFGAFKVCVPFARGDRRVLEPGPVNVGIGQLVLVVVVPGTRREGSTIDVWTGHPDDTS